MVLCDMAQKIRKAVIPAAGFGTRFLPATKAMPKEMLPLVDKPIIQYVVEEAVNAGIEEIIIVTGGHKRAIEDHFDYPYELEKVLRETGKDKQADDLIAISKMANFVYIRQKGPYGNGTPVMNAKQVIGDEPFAVLWGDELMRSSPPVLQQMLSVWEEYQLPCVSGVRVEESKLAKYGVFDYKEKREGVYTINKIVEKPKPGEAPSTLAAVGTYIFTPRIFELLEQTPVGRGNELWLVDAITALAAESEVLAVEIKDAHYHDTGNKLEYMKTVMKFGMEHPEIGKEFSEYLHSLCGKKD